ncbi:MAG TPA: hypothetical protein VHY08_08660 [Bacillota bacterium]|nr:hypothetical protein [Bacillota bacterium]
MLDYQISLLGPGDKYGRAYDTWDDWAHWTGRNLIFISEQPITDSSRTDKILQKSCTRYQKLPPLDIYRNGRLIWRYYLALGYNLKPDPYTAARQKYRL